MVIGILHEGEYAFYVPAFQRRSLVEHRLFNVALCEKCGAECEAPNPMNVMESVEMLEKFGIRRGVVLAEIGWCDALGLAVCPKCYEDATVG